jgi:hypothetical protein
MSFPSFATGEVLTAADMNAVGLWKVASQTIGTATAQVNLTNVFSSNYDNYRVVVRVNSATAAGVILCALGTGTPTRTNYKSYLSTSFVNWTAGAFTSVTDLTGLVITYAHPANNTGSFDLFNPNLATNTTSMGNYATDSNGGYTAGIQTDNTQFTSLHLIPLAGTITGGSIRVYGYRN